VFRVRDKSSVKYSLIGMFKLMSVVLFCASVVSWLCGELGLGFRI